MDYEFLKLLKDKKVADSYQFFDSCMYKLYLADVSFNALKNVVSKYQESESLEVQKVFTDAVETGKGTFKARKNVVDYLGVEIGVTVVIDKLTMEIMGLLHSFFDTFGQWLNASLLGEKAINIKKASLVNVIKEMQNFPEYTGQFIMDMMDLKSTDEYKFISDFNNTIKHRYQIYVENKFDILKAEGEVSIPNFSKDGRVHLKKEAFTTIISDLNFCKKILGDSKKYIEDYYANSDCNYTEHRLYNPKTYMVFKNRDDFNRLKNLQSHYHFIEVDLFDVWSEYQIMLSSDRMNGSEEQSIELYNSIYQIIMIVERGTTNIIGILKPADSETFKFNDQHNLVYRKYLPVLEGYHSEMIKAIFDGTFNYYPFLSDMTAVITGDEQNHTKET